MNIIENMKKTLGISCVEVYLLALLEGADIDVKSLFVNSFVEPQTVIEDFIKSRCNFTTYKGLERLQDIAKRQGIARLYFYRDGEELPCFSQHCSLRIYASGRTIAMLKGVKPDYKQSTFMPWRDDHYLLQFKSSLYDCYPPSKIEELDKNYYDGRKIHIEIEKECPVSLGTSMHTKSIENYKQEIKAQLHNYTQKNIAFDISKENLSYIRDALLIIKTSRRRLNEILSIETINEEIAELGKIIALLETSRLRGRITDLSRNIEYINSLEKKWRDDLQNG